MKSLQRACGVLIAVLALAVGIAACGGSHDSSSSTATSESSETTGAETTASEASETEEGGEASIDLGTETIEVEKGTPKIGYFAYGLSAYEMAYKAEIEELNNEGSDVTWIEAKYDPATQLKQLQTALTTGEYDAWIVEAVDPEGACKTLSELAPKQGIPVTVIVTPTCGRQAEPWGEGIWVPGTLNFVSDIGNVTWYTNALKQEKKVLEVGPDTEVGLINGPDIATGSHAFKQAMEANGIPITEEQAGDYTAPTAQKLTQAMLARNPDIEAIFDNYEGATPGIIAALKEAGKQPGEVKIADLGGSVDITVPNVKAGWLTASAVYDPRETAKTAIEQLELAFEGKQGPRILPADPPGASLQKPAIVTKENVGTFEPTY